MSDTGLLTLKSGIAQQTILSILEQNNQFLGALTENYIAQELSTKKIPLYYWKNDNTAEVDFVIQINEKIIPIVVKKGKRNKSISLEIFAKRYNCEYCIRFSQKNFGYDNNIKSIPLYAVYAIDELME